MMDWGKKNLVRTTEYRLLPKNVHEEHKDARKKKSARISGGGWGLGPAAVGKELGEYGSSVNALSLRKRSTRVTQAGTHRKLVL